MGGRSLRALQQQGGAGRKQGFFFNHHCLPRAILVVTANPQTKDLSPALVPLGYGPLPPIPGPPVRGMVPLCAASPTMLPPPTPQGEIPCFKKHRLKKKKKKAADVKIKRHCRRGSFSLTHYSINQQKKNKKSLSVTS